jgi:hypothetical protein
LPSWVASATSTAAAPSFVNVPSEEQEGSEEEEEEVGRQQQHVDWKVKRLVGTTSIGTI